MPEAQKGLSVNLNLPKAPLTENTELFQELLRVYNAIKIVASAIDSYTGIISEPSSVWNQLGVNRVSFGLNSKIYLTASVAINYGQTIGINGAGQAALAQDGVLGCIGFCSAPNGVLIGETAEVQLIGLYPEFPAASLTPGNRYYQSGTAGSVGVSGTGVQCIGFAISDQHLFFNPQLQY